MLCRKLKEEKNKNNLRFFTYSVYGGLIFLLVLFFVGIFLNIAFNGGNVNEAYLFNKRPTVIITGSMEPIIKVNSVVVLEPVSLKDLQKDDIIRYNSYNGYSVLHRVVYTTPTYVVTKGDANETNDTFPVTGEQITGRVVEIHNEFSDIISFIFGTFEYNAIEKSVLRALGGLVVVSLILFLFVVSFILIFELITITYFFKKYNSNLVDNSSYWLKNIINKEKQQGIVEEYNLVFKESSLFKKMILAYKFRRYYNGLCNIEEEVNKTDKRYLSLMNSLDKNIK